MKIFFEALALGCAGFTWGMAPAWGQIIPDNRLLPLEASSVLGNCATQDCSIRGGATRGGNLFHSFDRFKLGTGHRASFEHGPQIERIFGRVTGGDLSEIDGILSTSGASLFLLSPGGMVFGPRAQLDVGATFVGTSASRVEWSLGLGSFGTRSQDLQLLVDGLPQNFLFETGGGQIRLEGDGSGVDFNPNAGAQLALVGGGVLIRDRLLTLPTQELVIGSFKTGPNPRLVLGAEGRMRLVGSGSQTLRDVTIANSQLVAQATAPNGEVNMRANRLLLTESTISTLADSQTSFQGNIRLFAHTRLEIEDNTVLEALVLPVAGAIAGQIKIISEQDIELRGESQVRSQTFSPGGDISLTSLTKEIRLQDNSRIATASSPGGQAAGNITLTASEDLELERSFIVTETPAFGGNLAIDAGEDVELADGSLIQTEAGQPGAGALTVVAPSLLLGEGGEGGEEGEGGGRDNRRESDIIAIGPEDNLSLTVNRIDNGFRLTNQARFGNGRSEIGFRFSPPLAILPAMGSSPEGLVDPPPNQPLDLEEVAVARAAPTAPALVLEADAQIFADAPVIRRTAAGFSLLAGEAVIAQNGTVTLLTPTQRSTVPVETTTAAADPQPEEEIRFFVEESSGPAQPALALARLRGDRPRPHCRPRRELAGRSGLTVSGRGGVPPWVGERDRRSLLDLGGPEAGLAEAGSRFPVDFSSGSGGLLEWEEVDPMAIAQQRLSQRREAQAWLRNRRGEIRLMGENALMKDLMARAPSCSS